MINLWNKIKINNKKQNIIKHMQKIISIKALKTDYNYRKKCIESIGDLLFKKFKELINTSEANEIQATDDQLNTLALSTAETYLKSIVPCDWKTKCVTCQKWKTAKEANSCEEGICES